MLQSTEGTKPEARARCPRWSASRSACHTSATLTGAGRLLHTAARSMDHSCVCRIVLAASKPCGHALGLLPRTQICDVALCSQRRGCLASVHWDSAAVRMGLCRACGWVCSVRGVRCKWVIEEGEVAQMSLGGCGMQGQRPAKCVCRGPRGAEAVLGCCQGRNWSVLWGGRRCGDAGLWTYGWPRSSLPDFVLFRRNSIAAVRHDGEAPLSPETAASCSGLQREMTEEMACKQQMLLPIGCPVVFLGVTAVQ